MSDKPVAEMSFEEALQELEQVVGQLERGDVALEASIALYERGAELKKRCETKLKEAEEKVAALTLDGDGVPTGTTPVEGL
ncbi:MAG: exodeoxyribonuclease VII small subunit [Pseudomonadota bacterium]